jgi:hypothetical protein
MPMTRVEILSVLGPTEETLIADKLLTVLPMKNCGKSVSVSPATKR